MVAFACGPCKPKWRRMVDNVFARKAEPSSTNKLTFFCIHKPDKLDRVSQYIRDYLDYYLSRKNKASALLAMDAIDSLLVACHAQRLNLFVISFLNMIQLMLETNDVQLMLRGCKSFVEFSKIEEDTPNYHREYDALLSHFTGMCYAVLPNPEDTHNVRKAGIQGIEGIVRKTSTDQLQVNILEPDSMNKIVPSLLFNMRSTVEKSTNEEENEVCSEAISVFEMIVRWTSRADIKSVVLAILDYIDRNNDWAPNKFPLFVFERLTESSKSSQSAHRVVKLLVENLNSRKIKLSWQERVGMVEVIGQVVIGLAKDAVGPDVFHNFKSLLQILRTSIERTNTSAQAGVTELSGPDADGEMQFQEAIINTIAEFAKNLPDTQKIEILKFILNFDPMLHYRAGERRPPKALVSVLLKTMLLVATQYQTIAISNAFNMDFLNLLLRGVAVDQDPSIRIVVQKILQTLIDRHENTNKLLTIQLYEESSVKETFSWEKPQRQDVMFMKKTGQHLMENLYQQILDPSNKVDNLEHIYCTLGLLALELPDAEVVLELFRLILMTQQAVVQAQEDPATAAAGAPKDNLDSPDGVSTDGIFLMQATQIPDQRLSQLTMTHMCAIHAMLISLASLISPLMDCKPLTTYIQQVIQARKKKAPYLLPQRAFNRENTKDSYPTVLQISEDLLLNEKKISDLLNASGLDSTKLGLAYQVPKFSAGPSDIADHMSPNDDLSHSVSNLSLDGSQDSSPHNHRRVEGLHDYSFDAMRKIMTESADATRQRRLEEEKKVIQYFKKANFDQICEKQREKAQKSRRHLYQMLHPDANEAKDLRRRGSTSSDTSEASKAMSDAGANKEQEFAFGSKPLAVWDIEYPSMYSY